MSARNQTPVACGATDAGARGNSASGFTLIEVMIAAGILFTCLFAILALMSGALRNARALQREKPELASMAAAELFAVFNNTNQVADGTGSAEFGDSFPGYRYDWDVEEIATNGLCEVNITVSEHGQPTEKLNTVMFLPNLKKTAGGFR